MLYCCVSQRLTKFSCCQPQHMFSPRDLAAWDYYYYCEGENIAHRHTYIHIYTVLYAVFTVSTPFLYFVHCSFRKNDVSIAGQSSRLLLFVHFISWAFWLDYVWFCFICSGFLPSPLHPWGFCFLIIILPLPYGVFSSWQALQLAFLEESTVNNFEYEIYLQSFSSFQVAWDWMEGLRASVHRITEWFGFGGTFTGP